MQQPQQHATRQGRLSREITVVLLFKGLALLLIWVLFFSTPPVPRPNSNTTAAHLMGADRSSIQPSPGIHHD